MRPKEYDPDPLRAARGIVLGLLLSFAFWLVAGGVVWMLCR